MIVKNILKVFLPIIFIIFLIFPGPAYSLEEHTSNMTMVFDTDFIATLKYEAKDPTTLQNPVTDPNFNVMRNKELGRSRAIPLVVGVLIIAIIAPIATWMYFSK